MIAATHSPHFVSFNCDNLADLVRLCHRVEGRTCVHQIERDVLKSAFDDNLEVLNILEAVKEMPDRDAVISQLDNALEEIRHFLWLNPERSGLFFADLVLIVEGLSEQVLLNYLIRKGEVTVPTKWVFACWRRGAVTTYIDS